jgi:translation elongation factor EF-4
MLHLCFPESSSFSFGFDAGFLGMLHMELSKSDWSANLDMTVITTVPNVYLAYTKKTGDTVYHQQPI